MVEVSTPLEPCNYFLNFIYLFCPNGNAGQSSRKDGAIKSLVLNQPQTLFLAWFTLGTSAFSLMTSYFAGRWFPSSEQQTQASPGKASMLWAGLTRQTLPEGPGWAALCQHTALTWRVLSSQGYCLYIMAFLGEPCRSAWMLNKNPFVQDPVHQWISYRKEETD